jgi:hypothetical protein
MLLRANSHLQRQLLDSSEKDACEKFCLFFEQNCAQGIRADVLDSIIEYLPLAALASFFEDRGLAWLILRDHFPHHSPKPLPGLLHRIRDGHQKIFVILLWIGKAHDIEKFLGSDDLRDDHLPFKERPSSFPDLLKSYPNCGSRPYWEDFKEAQWRFCAPVLTDGLDRIWHKDTILPFTKTPTSDSGSSGSVSKIEIEESHNKLNCSQILEVAHGHPVVAPSHNVSNLQ